MIRLTQNQIQQKIEFINQYLHAENAATASQVDANANVTSKNIATMEAEINKDINIQINRELVRRKIAELFGEELAGEYIRQIEAHEIYVHDETSLKPYCVSISMYPFLLDGLIKLGGESRAPKHLESFCGEFVNLVFAISSQFAGALATVEFLLYFDHFATKDYGEDYLETHPKVIENHLQHVVYAINQPAAARGYQSVFWNISLYDEPYFDSMFGEFVFPDMSRPSYDRLFKLQHFFLKWFNAERLKAILTFPVVTAAMLTAKGKPVDQDFANMCAGELSEGNSFFVYQSESADSLASCCRLRNEIQDNGFSYTLGAGGVSTGSKSVLTINLNRCIQYEKKNKLPQLSFLEEVVDLVHKVQLAYNENLRYLQSKGMLPLFDASYIVMNRQYLTIGVNGMVEAAEFLGIPISDNEEYNHFVESVLSLIETYNKKYRHDGILFNCEMIPAENVGVKHAKWDKEDGYFVPRDCYNSYFFIVEDESLTVLDKFKLHGERYIRHLTGGSALHMNLEEHLSKKQYRQLLRVAAVEGCNYFTFNIPNTVCNDCGHIDKRYLKECPECHSQHLDYLTRVIGYMKRISNFSAARQEEAGRRYYTKVKS